MTALLAHPPLQLPDTDWRRRWLTLGAGDCLHRVSAIVWDHDEVRTAGKGVTVCGRRGRLHVPGILSRMHGERCGQCCEALDIPRGHGAPGNSGESWEGA